MLPREAHPARRSERTRWDASSRSRTALERDPRPSQRSYANVVTGGSQRVAGMLACMYFCRAPRREALKTGRKFLHGCPARAGDIAVFFDYLFPPREKEAAALVLGAGQAESVGGRGVWPIDGAARSKCEAKDAQRLARGTGMVQKSKAWGVFPSLAFFVPADLLGAGPLALGPALLDFRDVIGQPLFRDRLARAGH